MPVDRDYARLLNMAVEEQLKADEAKAEGFFALSEQHLQCAASYRDQAKALADRSQPKAVFTINNLPDGNHVASLDVHNTSEIPPVKAAD